MLSRYTGAIKTIASTVAVSGLIIVSLASCAAQEPLTKNVGESSGKNSSSEATKNIDKGVKEAPAAETVEPATEAPSAAAENATSDDKKSDVEACEYLNVELGAASAQDRTEDTDGAKVIGLLTSFNTILDKTETLAADATFIADMSTFKVSANDVIDYVNTTNESFDINTDAEYATLIETALNDLTPLDEFCATAIKG